MPQPSTTCTHCGEAISTSASHCRCGAFVGYPNYRAAVSEHEALSERAEAAETEAERRGVSALLREVCALVERSLPVIAMSFDVCDDLLRDKKYLNYHKLIEFGLREPAADLDHSDRAMVGEKLFPNYSAEIQYAALSPSGAGLKTYGPVAMRWKVEDNYLSRRLSLLEENSFTFFDKHGLGTRRAEIPLGRRATWQDRGFLGAAKFASRLTPATSPSTLLDMLLHLGATRAEDEFIEVHIYADKGLDTKDVDRITRQRAPKTRVEQLRWEIIKEQCEDRPLHIEIVE